MRLTIPEVSRLLNISERLLRRWVEEGSIPFYPAAGDGFFHGNELLEWAGSRKMTLTAEAVERLKVQADEMPWLVQALRLGGIHQGLQGRSRDEVLAEVVMRLPLGRMECREAMLEAFLAREALASTAIGGGIALPHVRNPASLPFFRAHPDILSFSKPAVGLFFLEEPVEYGALDGRPVGILFALLSPSVKVHLHLLSRLSFVLTQAPLRTLLDSPVRETAGLHEAFAEAEQKAHPLRSSGPEAP